MSDLEKIVKFPELGTIEAEAAAWIVRFNSGDVSAEDHAVFRDWQSQSVHHREAVARLSVVWAEFEALKDVAGSMESPPKALLVRGPEGLRSRLFAAFAPGSIAGLAALAAVLAVVVGLTFGTPGRGKTEFHAYETLVGVQKTISLADGSTILLNTDSRVEVRLSRHTRDIHLLRGEAYFEVAHDRSRPFSVVAGTSVVRAVGTAFDVLLLKNAVEVTVTKGKVELSALPSTRTGPADQLKGNPEPSLQRRLGLLAAGQNAVFKDTIERQSIVPDAELNRKLAWRNGFIIFSDESLSTVVEDISRYTNFRFLIEDQKLKDSKITGYFEVGQVDALLEALEKNFNLRVERLNDTLVRLSAAS